jgi:phage tail protein X
MATYITKMFDRLDKICHARYTTANNGVVEMVLQANPWLAKQGFILEKGLVIELPDLPVEVNKTPVIKQVLLW